VRVTVVLVPDPEWVAVSVPAMPGCVTQGRSRDEAIANAREAIALWLEGEAGDERDPLPETPALIAEDVSEALKIIDEDARGRRDPRKPRL